MEETGARRAGAGDEPIRDPAGAPGAAAADRDRGADGGKTLAQIFCLVVGAVLVAVGILGFFYTTEFGLPESLNPGSKDELLGLFDINGWHNVVHLATGALLLAASPSAPLARTVAIGFGLVYALVAVLGWIDGDDVIGLIPTNDEDNVLHTALAATGLLAGLASRTTERTGSERVATT